MEEKELLKIKPKKRAWMINRSKIMEGYLYSSVSVTAENVNEAKKLLLKTETYYLDATNEEVTYLTIPVLRDPMSDIVIYDGIGMVRGEINSYNRERERQNEISAIEANKDILFCYIKKNSMYYRPGCSGYTEYRKNAGTYPTAMAVNIAKGSEVIKLVPVDIKEHNNMIKEEIQKLESNYIEYGDSL